MFPACGPNEVFPVSSPCRKSIAGCWRPGTGEVSRRLTDGPGISLLGERDEAVACDGEEQRVVPLALVLDGADFSGAALSVGGRQAPMAETGPLRFELEAEGLAEEADQIGGVRGNFNAEGL